MHFTWEVVVGSGNDHAKVSLDRSKKSMIQVPSDLSEIILVGDFERLTPQQLFEHLTQPDLLTLWWPTLAEGEQGVGGQYVYSWPDQGWNLRGEFTAFEPGSHLAFTWCWDHEPVQHGYQSVNIWIQPYGETGSQIGLFHGKFSLTPEDQAARQGVVEGWMHFMMRLAGLTDGAAD
jgi:uncharacterized protein YndB with AHSA1/START domain